MSSELPSAPLFGLKASSTRQEWPCTIRLIQDAVTKENGQTFAHINGSHSCLIKHECSIKASRGELFGEL